MIEMSSGLGATAMGIGVSHGTGGEGVAGGCRLRAQNQSQASGSTMQHSNPQQSSQQQQSQQQQQLAPASQQQSQQQQRQTAGFMGRSKKDNCCLCWCCCCSCSRNKCLAAVGGNSTGTGAGEQGKKKGNAGVDGEQGSGIGVDLAGAGAGNGLDGHDGLDGIECCNLEEIRAWGSSFDKLMRSAAGRNLFREFLVSEYSEENIAFWLACEQLKRESNPETIEEKARLIYEDYISILSPKEVSLDSQVREIVNRNMVEPTPHTFDEAQLQIYTLMHRDSYPRFVNSEIYRRVARLNSSSPSPSTVQEHSGKSKGKRGAT
ncbi:PREDICTED: regulator of G-protein signaling 20 isoform X3 [Dinoponera quadriceps]|uniref:Regulator of G-protein signaling 20 isoform X3 n=1 Tax=Dinoponera quadriceps TaxID=609295 RepID=A0A6P3XVM5_DINQU|nr:PREDICTED: regulator of G-protein signaling 20 isoform X3 [Dinoponera quadriceps]